MSFRLNNYESLIHLNLFSALITIRLFESARIEFDAYRMDLELASGPANEEAQRSFAKHKVCLIIQMMCELNCDLF